MRDYRFGGNLCWGWTHYKLERAIGKAKPKEKEKAIWFLRVAGRRSQPLSGIQYSSLVCWAGQKQDPGISLTMSSEQQPFYRNLGLVAADPSMAPRSQKTGPPTTATANTAIADEPVTATRTSAEVPEETIEPSTATDRRGHVATATMTGSCKLLETCCSPL